MKIYLSSRSYIDIVYCWGVFGGRVYIFFYMYCLFSFVDSLDIGVDLGWRCIFFCCYSSEILGSLRCGIYFYFISESRYIYGW